MGRKAIDAARDAAIFCVETSETAGINLTLFEAHAALWEQGGVEIDRGEWGKDFSKYDRVLRNCLTNFDEKWTDEVRDIVIRSVAHKDRRYKGSETCEPRETAHFAARDVCALQSSRASLVLQKFEDDPIGAAILAREHRFTPLVTVADVRVEWALAVELLERQPPKRSGRSVQEMIERYRERNWLFPAGRSRVIQPETQRQAPPPPIPPSNVIVLQADGCFRIGKMTSGVRLDANEADVLCAFIGCDALQLNELQKKSGVDRPQVVLKRLKEKNHHCVFAPAITLPGRKGNGGYQVKIVREKGQN